MTDKERINEVISKYGIPKFKWINAKEIVVSQWVRLKCMYGCPSYGVKAACPPNIPSIAECRQFFNEYNDALILHLSVKLDHPDDRREWSRKINSQLLELEREVFLLGYYKVFLLFLDECRLCADCVRFREECKNKISARPSPEGMGVDVFSTVKKQGFPIEVLMDTTQEMNRYAFLLIE